MLIGLSWATLSISDDLLTDGLLIGLESVLDL
jgi:hypothetical protein